MEVDWSQIMDLVECLQRARLRNHGAGRLLAAGASVCMVSFMLPYVFIISSVIMIWFASCARGLIPICQVWFWVQYASQSDGQRIAACSTDLLLALELPLWPGSFRQLFTM